MIDTVKEEIKEAIESLGFSSLQKERKRRMIYRACPTCGAHLDLGEKCTDCIEKESLRTNENGPNDISNRNLGIMDEIKNTRKVLALKKISEESY